MTKRPRRGFWLKLAAGVLFAVVAYGGAYVALVEPYRMYLDVPSFATYAVDHTGAGTLQKALRRVFGPANWVDRRLRPRMWMSFEELEAEEGRHD